jgi:hypothetical protein
MEALHVCERGANGAKSIVDHVTFVVGEGRNQVLFTLPCTAMMPVSTRRARGKSCERS